MPLIKGNSKAAFEKNIETEVAHGKPVNQAVAIAYSTKRKAEGKKYRSIKDLKKRSKELGNGND